MSQNVSQQPLAVKEVEPFISVRVSTKGSCAMIAANPSGEEPHANDINYCGLYVDEHCTRLVALARIYEGSLIIPLVSLTGDVVKVSVLEILDEDASVHFPTSEVQCVRQTKNTFIAWTRHLVRPV